MTENCIRFKVRSTNCNTRRTHGRGHHIFINVLHGCSGMRGHLLVRNCGDSASSRGTRYHPSCESLYLRFLPLSGAVSPAHRSVTVTAWILQRANANHFSAANYVKRKLFAGSRPHLYDKPAEVLKVIPTRARIPL